MPAYGSFRIDPEAGVIYGKRGKPVGSRDSCGYVQVTVCGVGTEKTLRSAHRWIWEYANGPIPEGLQVNHKNGIKTDNRIANLELVTQAENIRHAFQIGLKSNKGMRHPSRKLTDEQVREIRRQADDGRPHPDIAAVFGISRRNVRDLARRKAWAHLKD